MAEYIDIDAPIDVAVYQRNRRIQVTLRQILESNDAKYECADVRPVVRGEWEDVNVRDYSTNINGGLPLNVASMCCSVCKRWHNEVYHYGNPTDMAHYCPNCGAVMREEQT